VAKGSVWLARIVHERIDQCQRRLNYVGLIRASRRRRCLLREPT
jgi:hypothetical protein